MRLTHFKGTSRAKVDHSPLAFDDVVQPSLDLLNLQRIEAETRASRLNGGNDLVDVVANDAKADVLGVLLDDASERGLRSGGHHIRLVEDDEFEAFGVQRARLGEVLDLLADDFDAAVVGRVELANGRRVWGVEGCKA